MTLKKAHRLVKKAKDAVAFEHRFARDTGTILRLVGGAMINVFDDGRYYIQGDSTEKLAAIFEKVEAQWDTNAWDGSLPLPVGQAHPPAAGGFWARFGWRRKQAGRREP